MRKLIYTIAMLGFFTGGAMAQEIETKKDSLTLLKERVETVEGQTSKFSKLKFSAYLQLTNARKIKLKRRSKKFFRRFNFPKRRFGNGFLRFDLGR